MGEITEEQMDDLKDCYSIFDKKGDNKVESERILDVLRSMGLNPLSKDVAKVLEESKLNGTRVDFETFVPIYQQFLKRGPSACFEDMSEALRTFDREQTGMVSAAEFRHILLNLADKMTEEQVEAIITPNEDANGQVPYEQVIKTVMAAPSN